MKDKFHKRTADIIIAVAVIGVLITAIALSGRNTADEPAQATSDYMKTATESPEKQTSPDTEASGTAVPDTDTATEPDAAETPGDETEGGSSPEDKSALAYGDKIFDTSYVHTVDILINDWEAFVESAPEEVYSNCSLVIDGERFDNVGIRAKGNSSLKVATKAANGRYSLKIEFDHYVDKQSYYGLDKLHLNNLSYDSTCVKDYLSYYLMSEMDVPSSYCSYVFVTVNGKDHGLYIALEGIEDSYLERNFGEDYGNILKPDDKHNQVVTETTAAENKTGTPAETTAAEQPGENQQPGGNSSWLKEGQVELATLTYVDDDIDSYVVLFNSAKSDFSDKEKQKLIKSIKKLNEQKNLDEAIDIDEVINYMTVQSFLVNYDGYTGTRVHNYYLYVDDDGIMSMLPWDYNLSFGTYGRPMTGSAVVNCPIDTPYGTEIGSRPMFDWIVQSYAYREQYHNRLLDLVNNYILNGKLEKEIDRVTGMIDEYIKRDPTKWVTYEAYQTGLNELKQIIALRGESVKQQVEGKIPSTVSGQAANPEKLLDTGDLDPAKTSTSFGN